MAQPTIEPITAATLPDFCLFLAKNMPVTRPAADWEHGLRQQWLPDHPNFGFMLRTEAGDVVGGIGAYYAARMLHGRPEKFCNITSWCVLDTYRQQSMKLAMAVISQPGFSFTDFSPTKVVAGTLKFFKFAELDDSEAVVLNLPGYGRRALSAPSDIEAALQGDALTIYRDHAGFSWLRHVVVGQPGDWCHVVYKRSTFKRLPTANVVYVGNKAALARHFRQLCTFLLARGMVSTLIECRMLAQVPWPAKVRSGFVRKVFLSTTVDAADIDYLYSERIALDL
jgi:hypothetical protein